MAKGRNEPTLPEVKHFSRRIFLKLAAGGAVASGAIGGCDGSSTKEGKLLLGFTNMLLASEFCATVERSIVEAAEKEGWKVFALDNNLDANAALANADLMVTRGVDFVLSFQALETLNPAIHEKYVEAGIPHFSIDGPMPDTVQFGADNWEAGKAGGAWLADYARKNWGGKVDGVIMSWISTWSDMVMRRAEGVIHSISQAFPQWNKDTIDRLDVVLDAEKGEAGFRAWMNAHPDARHILIPTMTNDIDGLSALTALQATGREAHAVICSGGGDPSAIAELKKSDNAFKASIAFFPEKYGQYLVPIIKDSLAGQPLKSHYSLEHIVLTRQNVREHYPDA